MSFSEDPLTPFLPNDSAVKVLCVQLFLFGLVFSEQKDSIFVRIDFPSQEREDTQAQLYEWVCVCSNIEQREILPPQSNIQICTWRHIHVAKLTTPKLRELCAVNRLAWKKKLFQTEIALGELTAWPGSCMFDWAGYFYITCSWSKLKWNIINRRRERNRFTEIGSNA